MGCEDIAALEREAARARLREAAARLDAAGWIRRYPLEAVVGALAAGFVVGSSPKTMQALAESLLHCARGMAMPPVRRSFE